MHPFQVNGGLNPSQSLWPADQEGTVLRPCMQEQTRPVMYAIQHWILQAGISGVQCTRKISMAGCPTGPGKLSSWRGVKCLRPFRACQQWWVKSGFKMALQCGLVSAYVFCGAVAAPLCKCPLVSETFGSHNSGRLLFFFKKCNTDCSSVLNGQANTVRALTSLWDSTHVCAPLWLWFPYMWFLCQTLTSQNLA